MLVTFSHILTADTKIISSYNFAAPLNTRLEYIQLPSPLTLAFIFIFFIFTVLVFLKTKVRLKMYNYKSKHFSRARLTYVTNLGLLFHSLTRKTTKKNKMTSANLTNP